VNRRRRLGKNGRDPEDLVSIYAERRDAIRSRLRDFAAVSSGDYFFELAYCLLTPQSSARNADAAIRELRESGFPNTPVDPEPILRSREHYIRFHKSKARRLLKAREEFGSIAQELKSDRSPEEMRDWLVGTVLGLGYKEATHFLRNIGRNGGLAILDRHILRNLKRYGAIGSFPSTLTKKRYLSIERRFMKFAATIGIPLDELDLLFWSMETGEIRK
jgi:N-glycosylase/DNA lyase